MMIPSQMQTRVAADRQAVYHREAAEDRRRRAAQAVAATSPVSDRDLTRRPAMRRRLGRLFGYSR